MAVVTSPNNDSDLSAALSTTPSASDDVILNYGDQDITDALTALAATALASFRSVPPRKGSLGSSSGSPVKIDADLVEILDHGRRHLLAGVSAQTIADLIYAPANAAAHLGLSAATVTNFNARTGTFEVEDDADIVNAYINGVRTGTLKSGAAAMTLLHVTGGVPSGGGPFAAYAPTGVVLERDAASVFVNAGGRVVFNHSSVSPATGVTVNGGRLDVVKSGTIASLSATAGVLDFSLLTEAVTISAWALYSNVILIKPWSTAAGFTVPSGSSLKAGPITVMEAAEAQAKGLLAA